MAKYKKQKKHKPQSAQSKVPASNIGNSTKLTACATDIMTFRLAAFDTWFFRESRPHDAVGASELASLFPPPVRTLAGAIRSYLGELIGIDWKTLASDMPDFDFKTALGGPDDLGQLQLNGPWIVHNDKRLYPAPLYLMHKQTTDDTDIQRLHPGQPVRCDLGRVRLPQLPADLNKGYKTLEQRWLTSQGLAKCLNGETPSINDVIMPEMLFSHEARLGIARDNASRKVLDGKLYQTRHLRITDKVQIELDVQGLDKQLIEYLNQHQIPHTLRLGGEGRMASLEQRNNRETLPFAKPKMVDSFIIHFVTPADFNGNWHPEDFKVASLNGLTVWQGVVNGIELYIEAAVIGKVHREGGWDMKNHQPHPVKSYIPAGSAWFCRLPQATDWPTLTEKLHGQCIGHDTAFGRGQILLGHWQDSMTR